MRSASRQESETDFTDAEKVRQSISSINTTLLSTLVYIEPDRNPTSPDYATPVPAVSILEYLEPNRTTDLNGYQIPHLAQSPLEYSEPDRTTNPNGYLRPTTAKKIPDPDDVQGKRNLAYAIFVLPHLSVLPRHSMAPNWKEIHHLAEQENLKARDQYLQLQTIENNLKQLVADAVNQLDQDKTSNNAVRKTTVEIPKNVTLRRSSPSNTVQQPEGPLAPVMPAQLSPRKNTVQRIISINPTDSSTGPGPRQSNV